MQIKKAAGPFTLVSWTDGHPHWCKLYHKNNPSAELFSVRPEDLHDLRYCIDRLLAELSERSPR